jgi:fucose permease
VAWPSVRDTFQLSQGAIALVFFGAGCSYFLSSFFTGHLLRRLGIGFLLAVSSLLVAACCFGYGLAPAWGWFVAGSLLHGLGSGAIDAGLNHYAAHHFSARHMNWLHGCYSLGATLGPLIMTTVLAAHVSWRTGYLIVATILLTLALLFAGTRRQWDAPAESSTAPAAPEPTETPPVSQAATLRHRVVWLQALFFFVYTGLEVTVGNWSFTVLVDARHVPRETAGLWVTIYWGSLCAGRFLLGAVVERVGIDRLLRLSTATAVGGTSLLALNLSPAVSAAALALTGLGLAAIYPCMMTKTPLRLGKAMAAHAIGFQVSAAMLGVAALPSVSGMLAQRFSLEWIPLAAVAMAVTVLALHEVLLARDRRVGEISKKTKMEL